MRIFEIKLEKKLKEYTRLLQNYKIQDDFSAIAYFDLSDRTTEFRDYQQRFIEFVTEISNCDTITYSAIQTLITFINSYATVIEFK